jgi:hypothetical protein
MSHHLSGLGLGPTSMNPRSHLTDLYAFHEADTKRTAFALNVNPLSPISNDAVDSESVYEFDIDTDSDAVADIVFQVRFSPIADGAQTASVTRVELGRGGSRDRIFSSLEFSTDT